VNPRSNFSLVPASSLFLNDRLSVRVGLRGGHFFFGAETAFGAHLGSLDLVEHGLSISVGLSGASQSILLSENSVGAFETGAVLITAGRAGVVNTSGNVHVEDLRSLFLLSSHNRNRDLSYDYLSLYMSLWNRNGVLNDMSLDIRVVDSVDGLLVIVFMNYRLSVVSGARHVHGSGSGGTSGESLLDLRLNHDVFISSLFQVQVDCLSVDGGLVVLGAVDLLSRHGESLSSFRDLFDRLVGEVWKGLGLSGQFFQLNSLMIVDDLSEVDWLGHDFLSRGLEGLYIVSLLNFLWSCDGFVVDVLSVSSVDLNDLLDGVSGRLDDSLFDGDSPRDLNLDGLSLDLVVHNGVSVEGLGENWSLYDLSSLYWGLNNSLSDDGLLNDGLGDYRLRNDLLGVDGLGLNLLCLGDVRFGVHGLDNLSVNSLGLVLT
jgi:hypothetical protein